MQLDLNHQTPMECKNQTDSILMSLLRSTMDDTQNKIQSINDPIECLIAMFKFYELAIIQIDAGLKLVKDQTEDQNPEINRKKMITDLIKLKHLLQDRVNNTKCSIIENDKPLMEGSKNVMMEQMKLDIGMLKETFDLTFKGYMDNQRFECSQKDAIIARLMDEQQQSTMQTMAIDGHYMILLNDCHKEFEVYDLETKVREDVFACVIIEVMIDMQIKLDSELRKIQNEIHVVLKPLIMDLQDNVNEKLRTNLSRMDEIKQQVDSLSRLMVSIRKEELVYKKAFAKICENLLLAETEVDLLGDQVEALQDLLQKIYFILEQNPSALLQNFQVMDILKMINKEFNRHGQLQGVIKQEI